VERVFDLKNLDGMLLHLENRVQQKFPAEFKAPALYYLLPMFNKGINIDPGLPASLFDPGAWQLLA
jgi:hypothetical protein